MRTVQSTWRTPKPLSVHVSSCVWNPTSPLKNHTSSCTAHLLGNSALWVGFFPFFSSIAGYNRFQRSLLSSASSSRPCFTAVGPEARKQKKLCSFLNHRDLSQESDEDPLFQEQNKAKQPFWSYETIKWISKSHQVLMTLLKKWFTREIQRELNKQSNSSEGQHSPCAKRMTAKERSNSKSKKTHETTPPQQTTKPNLNKFSVFITVFCEGVNQLTDTWQRLQTLRNSAICRRSQLHH